MRHAAILMLLLVCGCSDPQMTRRDVPPPDTEISGTEPSAVSSKWPDAFARRSYQLGITMPQFKSIRHPDQKDWPNAFPVFSNEARVEEYDFSETKLSGPWAEAGVIKSSYFWRPRSGAGKECYGAGLVLGDLNSVTYFYFLPDTDGGEPVLFFIESRGPSDSFSQIVALYRQAMGEPTEVSSEPVQNKLGATFMNETVEYHNPVSMIRIRKFTETLQMMKVEYILVPVMERLNQRLGLIDQDKARKL